MLQCVTILKGGDILIKDTTITIRINSKQKIVAQTKADKLNRSLTNYIENLIKIDLKELCYEGVSNSEEG